MSGLSYTGVRHELRESQLGMGYQAAEGVFAIDRTTETPAPIPSGLEASLSLSE